MKRLNIGCGTDIRPDCINIDIRNLEGVDLMCDVMELDLLLENNSIDEVLAFDIIEHVGFRDTNFLLKKIYDILKPGGRLIARVPDARHHAEQYLAGRYACEDFAYWMYGAQDYEHNFHKTCFDAASISRHLQSVGFSRVTTRPDGVNFIAEAYK